MEGIAVVFGVWGFAMFLVGWFVGSRDRRDTLTRENERLRGKLAVIRKESEE